MSITVSIKCRNKYFSGLERCLWLLVCVFICLGLGACTTASKGPGGVVQKVKYFELNADTAYKMPPLVDRMISNEPRYLLWGAVSGKERNELMGHYYTIWWKAYNTSYPVTVRFEYRQAKDIGNPRAVEQIFQKPSSWHNKSYFKVIGPVYFQFGKILAWKITLLQNGREIASTKSFLWN